MDKSQVVDDARLQTKLTHLQMIQGVISRMASDVQTLKTLAVSVTGAVVALAQPSGGATNWLVWISLLPIFVFWWLSAHSLHVERSYRQLYDLVRQDKEVETLSMDWRKYNDGVACTIKLAFSITILLPYAATAIVLILTAVFLGQSVRSDIQLPISENTNVKQ
jgi:hypothetical protein